MPKFFYSRGLLPVLVYLSLCLVCAEASTLRINQPKIRLFIPPGGAQAGVIEVDNTSEDTLQVKAYLEDWAYAPLGDGTKTFSPSGQVPFSASPWISFSPAEFVIPPFGRQIVNYRVKIPEGAAGGHYSVLFFESSFGEKDSSEGVGMNLVVRIGSLFYIEPEGTTIRAAEASNLLVKRRGHALEIKADLKNTGNVDSTCAGTFHIMDEQGMVIARGEFNKVYTLPGDSVQLVSSTQEVISEGRYDLVITLDLGKALDETGQGRGPVITKEASIDISEIGEVIKVGEKG
ncbi:MAG: hypothetical protein WC335_02705 [Candidatus Omnitrophota bacterium]|jgi:hypothetical protein